MKDRTKKETQIVQVEQKLILTYWYVSTHEKSFLSFFCLKTEHNNNIKT
jgi:hypothetical protein